LPGGRELKTRHPRQVTGLVGRLAARGAARPRGNLHGLAAPGAAPAALRDYASLFVPRPPTAAGGAGAGAPPDSGGGEGAAAADGESEEEAGAGAGLPGDRWLEEFNQGSMEEFPAALVENAALDGTLLAAARRAAAAAPGGGGDAGADADGEAQEDGADAPQEPLRVQFMRLGYYALDIGAAAGAGGAGAGAGGAPPLFHQIVALKSAV